jgi:hypothetical protein
MSGCRRGPRSQVGAGQLAEIPAPAWNSLRPRENTVSLSRLRRLFGKCTWNHNCLKLHRLRHRVVHGWPAACIFRVTFRHFFAYIYGGCNNKVRVSKKRPPESLVRPLFLMCESGLERKSVRETESIKRARLDPSSVAVRSLCSSDLRLLDIVFPWNTMTLPGGKHE